MTRFGRGETGPSGRTMGAGVTGSMASQALVQAFVQQGCEACGKEQCGRGDPSQEGLSRDGCLASGTVRYVQRTWHASIIPSITKAVQMILSGRI